MQTITSMERTGLASKRHLAVVVLLLSVLGVISLAGHLSSGGHLGFQAAQRTPAYLRVVLLEWLLFAFVVVGIRRHGGKAGDVIDSRPGGVSRLISSVLLGIAAAVIWMVIGGIIIAALHPTADELQSVESFLPHTASQKWAFALLTVTAGFCEEFIYRGYLLQQFRALSRSTSIGIVLQAALFALLHVTLPWRFVVSTAVMALFLGLLTGWRKTLIPAMLAHTLVNLLGGLLSPVETAR